MVTHLHPNGGEPPIRISESPRRSPQITNVLQSPVRSVYPEMQGMDSKHSHLDTGMRTTDFFDHSSEDGFTHALDPKGDFQSEDLAERRASARKGKHRKSSPTIDNFVTQCEGQRATTHVGEDGYQRLRRTQGQEHMQFAETLGTSFTGSLDELLPDVNHGTPPHASQLPRESHIQPQHGFRDVSGERNTPIPSSKTDAIIGAHAIAHEITLQALLRGENTLDGSLQAFAPVQGSDRVSLLPPTLRMHDPRSPRDRKFSTPQTTASKKVSVVPPPIDTSRPRYSLPADLVRTPYPTTPEQVYRKDFGRSPQSAVPSTPSAPESVLILSLRRANKQSLPKVTTLVIPAPNAFSGSARSDSNDEKERHFTAIDFDDEHLFLRLRACYAKLSGPFRLFSARSLSRIVISGPATKAADAGYGWLHQPRSPRSLAYRGLTDTFSEEKILQHYRNPRLGRSRYACVHWAHRLAAAPAARMPGDADEEDEAGQETTNSVNRDLTRKMDAPEGLEFVHGWSIRRILLAAMLVLVISAAATLLWVFLGRNTTAGPDGNGGYRDAGVRVGTGILLGICSLLLGLSGMAGWLGVSWLLT